MTFVSISALTFPHGTQDEIERRFAARRKAVDTAAGFEHFELLRPLFGESRYFVVTRWESYEAYDAWSSARPSDRHPDDEGRGMSVDVLGFDVVELETGAS